MLNNACIFRWDTLLLLYLKIKEGALKNLNQDKLEKMKLIGIILFCILVGSGSAKGFIDHSINKEEITLDYQENLESVESTNELNSISLDSFSENKSVEVDNETHKKININTADSQILQSLQGIGPTKAESIIKYRVDYGGFTAVEEITEVKGIGAATFLKIKDFIAI